jgi:hypothetical protein
MRLTDIMSGADLSIYPQIGLLIFLAVFASIAARVYGRRRADDHERWAAMPLDDAPPGGQP